MKKILVNLKDWFDIKENIEFSSRIKDMNIILFPAMPYLFIYKDMNITLGAQDVSSFESGAHTGAVSMDHLKEFGCTHVLLNHNELRIEENDILSGKISNAINNDVEVIVCVNDASKRELDRIEAILKDSPKPNLISIAYEPYEELPIDKIKENLDMIRESIKPYNYNNLIYGGSISTNNIEVFEKEIEVDGYLISRHALDTDELKSIIDSVL